jgi:dienelactone hydrolase
MYTLTEDGINIAFDVFEPANDNSLDKKAVILGHGICANKEFLRLISKDLAENGFVAVAFDFRGHGRSSGDFNFMGESIQESLSGGNFNGMPDLSFDTLIQDVMAIKEYLNSRGDIDMDNLGYLGYSMGGGVGFTLCAEDNAFRAFVGLAPVPDYMNTNLTNPQNLLVIVGKYDEAISMPLLSHAK